MEKAILLAIEKGGYNWKYPRIELLNSHDFAHVMQDPLFWQSLGKALGWDETALDGVVCRYCGIGECADHQFEHYEDDRPAYIAPETAYALRFFELKLSGSGDIDKFWEELIK